MFHGIPVIQIRGSSILEFYEPIRLYNNAPSAKRRQNMREQSKKAYSGGMTTGSRKRLAKAVTVMTQAIKPRWVHNPVTRAWNHHTFSFITLTVASSTNITARYAYDNLLGAFLDWMTKTIGAKNPLAKTYIWKAELQKRGQIHYHITTPAFIHYKAIRVKWNELQRKAGLLDQHAKKFGNFDPNGTDIHKTYNVRKMDRYIIKELGKSVNARKLAASWQVDSLIKAGEIPEEKRKEFIDEYTGQDLKTIGKIWGCSSDLAGAQYFSLEMTRDHEKQIAQWIEEGKAWKKTEDFFSITYVDGADPPELLSRGEKAAFEEHLQRIRKDDSIVPSLMAVPVDCIAMDNLNIEKEYTWEQLEIELF